MGLLWARELTFEDRVKAQAAIERVYWAHRIWPKENLRPKPPLEQVMPEATIRAKVEDYLRKSAALAKDWKRPITAQQLQDELDRMLKTSRDPRLLEKIFGALGDDPFMIAETLARQTLADRLIRNWYSFDSRFHGGLRRKAESAMSTCRRVECMKSMGGESRETTWRLHQTHDADSDHDAGDPLNHLRRATIDLDPDDWRKLQEQLAFKLGDASPASSSLVPFGRFGRLEENTDAVTTTALVSRSESEITTVTVAWPKQPFDAWWAAEAPSMNASVGSSFTTFRLLAPLSVGCTDDTWRPTHYDIVAPRTNHRAVWTGTEMIVWGGYPANGGDRYNPSTDTWTSISPEHAPEPRDDFTAIWTGTEVIVWGGSVDQLHNLNTGGRYDPSTDRWSPTSSGADAPEARTRHTAVWTGSEMIVWGGIGDCCLGIASGGRYKPSTDTWTPTSMGPNLPSPRYFHTAIWTGSEMIIWGGIHSFVAGGDSYFNTGGRYDPTTDTWTSTSTGTYVPSERVGHTAVWTGLEMIVWGGFDAQGRTTSLGGRYSPEADTWAPTSTGANLPFARRNHAAVWTGSEMIVWGGDTASADFTNTGGRYDPSTDSWTRTSTAENVPPSQLSRFTAVWTGSEMIIWGGYTSQPLNTGSRYRPDLDTWTPTSTGSAPSARAYHTAVWTGVEMVVWGGANTTYLDSGARYTPSVDTWAPTAIGPGPRVGHTAVWTGSEMIIWGGGDSSGITANPVSRYNPSSDTWTTGANTPSGRTQHTAVWTGSRMIVWGGTSSYYAPILNTGGVYDPSTDSWTPTSTGVNVPAPRYGHTAIWTGKTMIVWGGRDGASELNSGGSYDPIRDSWIRTSMGSNVPTPRKEHTAIWTGTEMIVWGGDNGAYSTSTGARYNPLSKTWRPTAAGSPLPRYQHTAIWTGAEMIVWGGHRSPTRILNTGGRYNPLTDSWTATSTADAAPDAREGHTAVWSGTEMIVWGGYDDYSTSARGARYCACLDGVTVFRDADDDGHGDSSASISTCGDSPPAGYVFDHSDCNDSNASIHPGSAEVCNGLDDDCDGSVDNTSCGVGACHRAGSCVGGVDTCEPGLPTTESCDGIDNDCDGTIDGVPGGSCTLFLTRPLNGDLLDCRAGAAPPTFEWSAAQYDKFRAFISWVPTFSSTTTVTSGDTLLTTNTWRVPARKWRTACSHSNQVLYIRVLGIDREIQAGSPGRKFLSPSVVIGVQK